MQVYMKKVKEYLEKERPDEVEAFENGAKAYAPKLMAKFDDLEFVSKGFSLLQWISFISLVYRRKDGPKRHGCLAELSRGRRHTFLHVGRRNMKT